ncbi:MAG: ATP-binding cassette domain-containing protein [Actinobacteria bacterium]|nr:ATP-binding cassette domain-containing protein [Actinomycetota bacterium]
MKRFGDTVALDGVDLRVSEGEVLSLLGPNGAGKTTLVRILATLLDPDEGGATVFGHDVVREAAAVRRIVALTGQFAAVDELLTGRENLRMFGRLFHMRGPDAARRGNELLERFGLADAGDRSVRTYSGGMRRRLDLASSLLVRPRLLFLDEPTTGLDPRSRRQMWEVIRDLVREGTTLLLTTQYLDEADTLADRIAVIDSGVIIANGTGDELKDQVGGQVVVVRLRDPTQRADAVVALRDVGCEDPHGGGGDGRRSDELALPVHRDGVGLVVDAARALERSGIDVLDLALRRPTLDDVFLELTGHRAVDRADDVDATPQRATA